jgi:hypothetical protein
MPKALKFLDSYTKDDKEYYPKRENKIKELYQKVKSNPITLFYGLSGTGKTSLILCGLGNRFDDLDWMPFVIRRGNNTDILTATKNNIRHYAKSDNEIEKQLDEIYYNYFRPIYLIFDQLEELFIYGEKEEKKSFINLLVNLKTNYRFIKTILVLREEYFVHLDDFESAIPDIFQSRVRLEPVNETEVIGIIKDISRALKVKLNEDVISQILTHITVKSKGFQTGSNFELDEKKIELSYLQVYFHEILEINKKKLKDIKGDEVIELTIDDLPKLGSINDVLTDYLDKCVKDIYRKINNGTILADEQQIWNVISSLVSYKGTKQKKYVHEILKIVS